MDDPLPPRVYVYRSPLRRASCRVLDATGDALRGSPGARARRPPPPRVERILAIKLDHLGDLVLAFPALASLRAAYPGARLDALVAPASGPLLAHTGLTDEVILADAAWYRGGRPRPRALFALARSLRARRYDLALDLRGDPIAILLATLAGARFRVGFGDAGLGFLLDRELRVRAGTHQATLLAEAALAAGGRPLTGPPEARLVTSPEERVAARTRLGERAGRAITFHLGAGDPRKVWPPEGFGALAQALAREGHPVVVVGGKEDTPWSERFQRAAATPVLDLAGALSLRESLAVIEASALLIGNDAGPAHFAAALATPVLVAFAAVNDPERWRPCGERVRIVPVPVPAPPGAPRAEEIEAMRSAARELLAG
jgi:ADP-heptose:LPS heptosyltransferase